MWNLLCFSLAAATVNSAASGNDEANAAINAVLDDWHQAAAAADEERYFRHIAPDGVFLGTDATERWTKAEFQKYAHPHFAKGKAWSFKPKKRIVTVHAEGKAAWFDELLDTPNLGLARGSGVLALDGTTWKIAQYNLSVPIPNERFAEVKKLLEAGLKREGR
jgi:hypothetical protein